MVLQKLSNGEILNLIQNLDKNKLCNILELTDKLLSGKTDLKVMDTNTGLAYTDNKNIFLALQEILKFCNNQQDFLIIVKGLNYHELAHSLYTDYDFKMVEEIVNKNNLDFKNYKELLNCVEDTRIENLFSIKYNKLIDYFGFTANKIILKDLHFSLKNKFDKHYFLISYLSLYGRKFLYLDSEKRKILYKIREHIIKEIGGDIKDYEVLIDNYNNSEDLQIRLNIIVDLYKLFSNNQNQTIPNKNTGLKKKITQKENNAINEDLKQLSQDLKDLIKDLQEKQEQETGTEQEQDTEQENKKENKENKPTQQQKKPTDKKENSKKDLEDSDLKVFENLEQDTEQEIKQDIKQVFNKQENSEILGFSLTSEHKTQIQQLTNTLKILKNGLGSNNQHNQKKGKFDIRSYINSQNNNNTLMFKTLQDNTLKNKSKLAISFLLDNSGSMEKTERGNKENNFNIGLSSTYILSKSLENLGNKTEVITFNNSHKVLKEFNKNGFFGGFAYGGTCLSTPLNQAIQNLNKIQEQEKINNRFVFIISDGGFCDNPYNLLEDIKKDKKIKVIWILVNKYNRIRDSDKNYFDYTLHISNFKDLNREINKIVYKIQKGINDNLKQGIY